MPSQNAGTDVRFGETAVMLEIPTAWKRRILYSTQPTAPKGLQPIIQSLRSDNRLNSMLSCLSIAENHWKHLGHVDLAMSTTVDLASTLYVGAKIGTANSGVLKSSGAARLVSTMRYQAKPRIRMGMLKGRASQ